MTERRLIMHDPDWIPEVRVSGSSFEAGQQLGAAWEEALRGEAAIQDEGTPWWKHAPYGRLMERYAPHLPDLYRGMAKGAGIPEDRIATLTPMGKGLSGFDDSLTIKGASERSFECALYCYASLMDHTGYPTSICRHQSEAAMTCGVVIAEPTARRLHVARGPVCMHWPRVHSL